MALSRSIFRRTPLAQTRMPIGFQRRTARFIWLCGCTGQRKLLHPSFLRATERGNLQQLKLRSRHIYITTEYAGTWTEPASIATEETSLRRQWLFSGSVTSIRCPAPGNGTSVTRSPISCLGRFPFSGGAAWSSVPCRTRYFALPGPPLVERSAFRRCSFNSRCFGGTAGLQNLPNGLKVLARPDHVFHGCQDLRVC